ncbi:MAG TPA: RDD family protein [Acidimicrobiia bacterium]|nr:RDD family protein [Acidimicrobiia bacterium]
MAYQPQRDPTNVLGRRFGAFFIDFVLGNAITIAFLAGMKSGSYTSAPTHACTRLNVNGFTGTCVQLGSRVYTWDSGKYALGLLLGVGVVFLNSVILQGITGASVGKMITGVRVVNTQGAVCGIGRAFLRWVLLIVDLFCAGLVGLISVLATHPHRRVGDMVAGTYVIGTADVGQPVVAPMPPTYAYAGATVAGGWAPPQPAQSGWGAPPPAQPAQPAQWGAPPAPAPQPTEQQAGWAAPQSPQPQPGPQPQPYVPPQPPPQPQPQQPYVPPPPPSAPPTTESAPPSWGAPPTYPPPPTYPAPPSWGAPPASEPEPPAATPPAQNGGESWWDKGVEGENRDDEPES